MDDRLIAFVAGVLACIVLEAVVGLWCCLRLAKKYDEEMGIDEET